MQLIRDRVDDLVVGGRELGEDAALAREAAVISGLATTTTRAPSSTSSQALARSRRSRAGRRRGASARTAPASPAAAAARLPRGRRRLPTGGRAAAPCPRHGPRRRASAVRGSVCRNRRASIAGSSCRSSIFELAICTSANPLSQRAGSGTFFRPRPPRVEPQTSSWPTFISIGSESRSRRAPRAWAD